jgi:hypothetical protein
MAATCLETSVRVAAAAFVRQIGNLSHEPEVRDRLLRTAVREVTWQLLDDFRDYCRLAEQLAIMSQLAWLATEAVQPAGSARPEPRVGGPRPDNDRTVLAPGGSPAPSPKSRPLAPAGLAQLEC